MAEVVTCENGAGIRKYAKRVAEYPTNETWSKGVICSTQPKVLGYKNVNFGGLVNQLRLLSSAIALACAQQKSIILDVWTVNYFPGDHRMGATYNKDNNVIPIFKTDLHRRLHRPWSDMIDYKRMNNFLSTYPRCGRPIIEPRKCIYHGPVECPYESSLFGDPIADKILENIPFVRDNCRTPRSYNAIHFNLDVDWLVVGKYGVQSNEYWDYLKLNAKERHEYHKKCCSKNGFLADYAKNIMNSLLTRVLTMPKAPLFVATSIGKPGYYTLLWLVLEFRVGLKQHGIKVFACGRRSSSVEREMDAGYELSIVGRAANFMVHTNSTFSALACLHVQSRGGSCYHGYGSENPELNMKNLIY
jgi:hypothetical protein